MRTKQKFAKLISILLTLTLLVGMFPAAAVNEAGSNMESALINVDSDGTDAATSVFWSGVTNVGTATTVGDGYTYNDWVSNLSANWNIHTYETNDQAYPIDFVTSGLYSFIFNDALNPVAGREPYEGYMIVPEMAASLPVDVTEQVKAEGRFYIPEDAAFGFAYTIDLNPLACFEDGTPITADDYVESMKRLLDPKLQNYRASGYYEGDFCIAGAQSYAHSGMTVLEDNGVTGAYTVADLVKGEDGVYTTPNGGIVYIAVAYGIDWCGGNSLADYVNDYGDTYFGMETWDELYAMIDENGLVPLTDEALALLIPVTTTNSAWGETEADIPNYLVYGQTYPEVSYDTVGLYKSGEYQITLVLNQFLAGFNLLYNLAGNWLVKTDLYDACLQETDYGWVSTYCTSMETTCSYGPYKMSSYEPGQSMHFVKNENWYGYTDGKHVYVDPNDGLTYPMYMTTEIDCVVPTENVWNMFVRGELMQYGLSGSDFDYYRDSPYCYFTPGQATYFLLINGNMPAIKDREAAADFDQSAYDLETLTLTSFHRALGLTYDKDLYCANRSPADSGAFGLIGHAYISDPMTGERYRDTTAAKLVLCEVYGVDPSNFNSLDEAVDSITGYDPVAAKMWYQTAYDEALAAGYITDTNNDGTCDQTIRLTYSASSVSSTLLDTLAYLTEKANEVTAGTPFEGKIEFVASDPLGNDWSSMIKSGLCDTCLGGWTGSAMNPYGLIEVYTNPSYQYDAQWFDSTSVDMTLTINGESVTLNLHEWTLALNGTVVTKNGRDYNFGDGIVSNDIRVEILAGLEKTILLEYNYLPFIEDGSMALLTQKAHYVVEDYNPVMGRGGIAYLRYYYNDAEWAAYVAECGGKLNYAPEGVEVPDKPDDPDQPGMEPGLKYREMRWYEGGIWDEDKSWSLNDELSIPINYSTYLKFYFFDGENEIPVSLDELIVPANISITREDGEDYLEVYAVSFGTEFISYERDGETYSLPVSVILPDIGFYSDVIRSEETYLSDFTITGECNTFYLVARDDMVLSDVTLRDEFAAVAQAEAVSDTCWRITVTGNVESGRWYDLSCNGVDPWGDSFTDWWYGIQIVDAAPGLKYRYMDYDGSSWYESGELYGVWDAVIDGTAYVKFYFVDGENETPVSLSELTFSGSVSVEAVEGEEFLRICANDFGKGSISYQKNGKTYSVTADIGLPNFGFSSSQTLSEKTYLSAFKVTDEQNAFYIVSDGHATLTEVVLLDEFAEVAQIEKVSDTCWKITVTGDVYGDWYSVSVDGTFEWGDEFTDWRFGIQLSQYKTIASGTCGKNLKWKLMSDGALIIYGEGAMDNFSVTINPQSYSAIPMSDAQSAPWSAYSHLITTVVVENGVTSIGDNAFAECVELKEIEIPETVTEIGDNVFTDCEALETVTYIGSEEKWDEIEVGVGNEKFEESELVIVEVVLGDVNGDGKINGTDTNLIFRHVSGTTELTGDQRKAADVNGDGKVNGTDTNLVFRFVSGVIDTLG